MNAARSSGRGPSLAMLVDSIPHPTPKSIVSAIRAAGYVGQEGAVRAAALMAYRHVGRLKKIHVQGVNPDELPPKTNMMFVGPTGCGKTYLNEILFRDTLKLPTVIVDMTTYSETGYVGQDVSTILTRLLYAADLNPLAASIGVVCLDEFDKLASGQNNAVFAGAGTTKDVSGLGVQRELLKMLEATEVSVSVELSHSEYAPRSIISTRDIPFVACGAFSGLKSLIEREGEHIGFRRTGLSGSQDRIAVSYADNDVELTRNFLNYGFLPELIGRFKRMIAFGSLGKDELSSILRRNLLPRYRTEFATEGKHLIVSREVLSRIVEDSIKKETGARGLESSLIRLLEEAAFEAYSERGSSRVELLVRNGELTYRIQ